MVLRFLLDDILFLGFQISVSFKYIIFYIIYMRAKTITIPMEEYERLKKLDEIDYNLISQLVDSLEDAKNGNIHRVA